MSRRMESGFYVTVCPPGEAEGAGEFDAWLDYGAQGASDVISRLEDDVFDDEDELRPIDYFFPGD